MLAFVLVQLQHLDKDASLYQCMLVCLRKDGGGYQQHTKVCTSTVEQHLGYMGLFWSSSMHSII